MSPPDQTDLYRALGNIEAKVDRILEDLPELRTRVSKLESWRTYLAGAAAVLGVLGGIVLKFL